METQKLKRCDDCYFADGAWCMKLRKVHTIYGCREHITKEELIVKVKEEMRRQEEEYERKMNFVLTIMINCASATQIMMELQ